MKFFWQGFSKGRRSPLKFKRHVIVLYWKPQDVVAANRKDQFVKIALSHPSVLVKIINIEKEPVRTARQQITEFPTIVLLRNGREVSRAPRPNRTVIEQFFRKAII